MTEDSEQQCVFCKIIKGEIPSKKIYEDNIISAILDINPANLGHMLLLPKTHYQIMPQVPETELGHMFKIAKHLSNCILKANLANSSTIFVANGAGAGQKAPHFMIHVIPRLKNDGLFDIPKRKATEPELEKVKNVLIGKLKERLGRDPVPINENKNLDKNIPEPLDLEKEPEKKEKVKEEKSVKKKPKKETKKKEKNEEDVDIDKLTDLLTK